MDNFLLDYEEKFLMELQQFLFLCDKQDRTLDPAKYRKEQMTDFVRLGCIALVLGYKRIFLKIVSVAEDDFDEFAESMNAVQRNFALLDEWMLNFAMRTPYPEAKKIICDYWDEQKKKINPNRFSFNQLF